jgi:hypothetical protein
MYLVGLTLLLAGFLLCLSIVWAPIGFFAMGIGLICMLVAEKRNKSSRLRLEQLAIQPSLQPRSSSPAAPVTNTEVRQERATHEKEKWRLLVESDPDIARVERVLTQYGPQYVDQLARAYVVFNNKAFLPIILKMIIASARLNAEEKQGSIGYVSDNIEDRRSLVDEVAIGDLLASSPEIPLRQPPEIALHKAAHRSDDTRGPSPRATRLEIGIFGGAEPTSQPTSDVDEADDLIRLFDKLISSRR